jgi:hypothetical protein
MNSLPKPLPAVNTHVDSSGERDLILTALRVAATRTRLQTNVLIVLALHCAKSKWTALAL